MKLMLLTLMIAWVAVGAHTVRGGEDEALVDQSSRELQYRRRFPRRRKSNPTLFLVKDDRRRSTSDCTLDLRYALDNCIDVEITRDDGDADQGDYLFYIDNDTDCEELQDYIEDVLGCTSGYRRYRYGSGFRRYRFYKHRWWNRYHKGETRKSKKSKKDDDEDDKPRRRWYPRRRYPRRPWWNRDDDEEEDRPHRHRRRRYPYPRKYDEDDGDDDEEEEDKDKTKKADTKKNDKKVEKDDGPKERPFKKNTKTGKDDIVCDPEEEDCE